MSTPTIPTWRDRTTKLFLDNCACSHTGVEDFLAVLASAIRTRRHNLGNIWHQEDFGNRPLLRSQPTNSIPHSTNTTFYHPRAMESTPLLSSYSYTAHLQPSHHRVTRHLHGELDTGPNNTRRSKVVCFMALPIFLPKKQGIRHLIQGWQPCFKAISVGLTFPLESNGAKGIASGDRCLDPRVVKPSSQCHESFLTLKLGVFFANLKNPTLLMSLIWPLTWINWILGSAIFEKLALTFKVH